MSTLRELLGDDFYIKNDIVTFDVYLGDLYSNTEWRNVLKNEFCKELYNIRSLTEENVKRAARKTLRAVTLQFNEEFKTRNSQDMHHSYSDNELITNQICINVENALYDNLNIELLKNMGKLLGVSLSQKSKTLLCTDIASKLTKPLKVTKQLQKGRWEPIDDSLLLNRYKHLIDYYGNDDNYKLPSLKYAIIQTCKNMEDTLYHDLDSDSILFFGKQLNVPDYNNRDTYELCKIITLKMTMWKRTDYSYSSDMSESSDTSYTSDSDTSDDSDTNDSDTSGY